MDAKAHWETIYTTKEATQVSWYQAPPRRSLQIIEHTGVGHAAAIIDVGGGASTLVGHLLDAGYQQLTVLDISEAALKLARQRLGSRSDAVRWVVADITQADLSDAHFDCGTTARFFIF